MLTSQDVVAAYRLLLGREPESTKIVQNYIDHSDFDGLRRTLLGSGEFAERLGRDPRLLPVPIVALAATAEVRRYQARLQELMSMALPLADLSVLIIGDESASLAGVFLDRRCKVDVVASPDMGRILVQVMAGQPTAAANLAILKQEPDADDEGWGRYDAIVSDLPDGDSDVMRVWLDDAADACSGWMVLSCRTAPGRSEDVFLTRRDDRSDVFDAVPTRPWMVSRLRERFEHVYAFSHDVGGGGGNGGQGQSVTRSTFVAARRALTSPVLEACSVAGPRATPSATVTSLAAR